MAGLVYGAVQARKNGARDCWPWHSGCKLDFNPEPDHAFASRFNFLKQLVRGDNRYAINVLSGTYQQYDVLAFDYHYETYYYDKKAATRSTTGFHFSSSRCQ